MYKLSSRPKNSQAIDPYFLNPRAGPAFIYRRLRERGRMMPEGLSFVSSWVSADLGRCFQLMEAADVTLFQRWIAGWSDLMEFEVVPVVPGADTAGALAGELD